MAESPRRRQGSHFSSKAAAEFETRPSRRSARRGQVSSERSRRHGAVAGRTRQASAHSTGVMSAVKPRTKAQRAAASRGGHSMRGPVLGAIVGVVVVLVLVVTLVVPRLMSLGSSDQASLPNQGSEVSVSIPEGSGAIAIASALKDAGVIADSGEFVTEVQRQHADSSLKSGSYSFTVGMDLDSIISRLTTGPNASTGLTIPEGLTLAQTAAKVSEVLGISQDDFIAQAKASNYVADFPFLAEAADDSLEGFLYPKTYDFSGIENVSADTVIRAMLTQYATDVLSLDFDAARSTLLERYGLELSNYDILKLASIVEREAVTQDQRPKVSSTFYNRLKIGMALQSDATMMYVTGGQVTADDLKRESPYNTYLNAGLTPTPICSPSIESIKAALEPAQTDYLYFYITQTDEWFSATYDDHLAAIEQNR